jgi:hypothetical protein
MPILHMHVDSKALIRFVCHAAYVSPESDRFQPFILTALFWITLLLASS